MTETGAKMLPVGTRIGEYAVTGLVGAGGMGTVYAGVHPVIGKRVAIKVLAPLLSQDERMVDRFVQEARAVVKIQHRNIIDVFAFGHAPGVGHYFVMPLLDGESLGDRIKRAGPMSVAEALPIVKQIADALDTAHETGVFHRDLKPDNVFLATERTGPPLVLVLDFGIAKLLDSDVTATQTGVQMGTPLFMSPEQWDGEGVDHRTDIYALGVLVHHLLTGRYPFESKSPIALMNSHANQSPTSPSEQGADPAIDGVVAQALAKDKTRRFDNAGALYRALTGATGTGAHAVTVVAPVENDHTLQVPPARRRWLAIAIAVVGVGAVGVAAGLLRGNAPSATRTYPTDAAPSVTAVLAPPADAAAAQHVTDAAPRTRRPLQKPPRTTPRKPPRTTPRKSPRTTPRTKPAAQPIPTPRIDAGAVPTRKKPKNGEKTKWGETAKPF